MSKSNETHDLPDTATLRRNANYARGYDLGTKEAEIGAVFLPELAATCGTMFTVGYCDGYIDCATEYQRTMAVAS